MSKVVQLAAYRKRLQDREARAAARRAALLSVNVPSNLKAYRAASGNLVCPECGTRLGAVRRGRKRNKDERPFQLVCVFGCGWHGAPHIDHDNFAPTACAGCCTNPRKAR